MTIPPKEWRDQWREACEKGVRHSTHYAGCNTNHKDCAMLVLLDCLDEAAEEFGDV